MINRVIRRHKWRSQIVIPTHKKNFHMRIFSERPPQIATDIQIPRSPWILKIPRANFTGEHFVGQIGFELQIVPDIFVERRSVGGEVR